RRRGNHAVPVLSVTGWHRGSALPSRDSQVWFRLAVEPQELEQVFGAQLPSKSRIATTCERVVRRSGCVPEHAEPVPPQCCFLWRDFWQILDPSTDSGPRSEEPLTAAAQCKRRLHEPDPVCRRQRSAF